MDEFELLEAVSRFGYGNWKDIAQSLSSKMTDITPQEVADHYVIHYILSDLGDYTWNWKKRIVSIVQMLKLNEARRFTKILKESKDFLQDFSQADLDSLGYMPKRDDFEREFDNEAEAIISNLTFGIMDDDVIETKFKLSQIGMYQARLLERFRKKSIVRKFGLVRKFFNEKLHKISNDDPELKNMLDNLDSNSQHGESSAISPFLRYYSKEGLQDLFLDLLKEYSLKVIIRKLLKYKQQGLTKLSEIKEAEEKKLKDYEGKLSRVSTLKH